MREFKWVGPTISKMLEVSTHLAYPSLRLLDGECEVGVGCQEAFKRLLPGVQAPKDYAPIEGRGAILAGLLAHVRARAADGPGLRALAAQTALDLTVLTVIYLPTFYVFKASVFSGSLDPSVWVGTGLENYQDNFSKDEFDLMRVMLPADLVLFSVPLYLRLPLRHVVSFFWTTYLSFSRGGH